MQENYRINLTPSQKPFLSKLIPSAVKVLFLILFFPAALYNCSYENEEEAYADIICDTTDVSYAFDIKPILQASCYQCHSNAIGLGNIRLENYEDVKAQIDAISGAINHSPGYSPMPKGGGKLDDCSIEKIEIWMKNGALNN